jgi:hypothetical protein
MLDSLVREVVCGEPGGGTLVQPDDLLRLQRAPDALHESVAERVRHAIPLTVRITGMDQTLRRLQLL